MRNLTKSRVSQLTNEINEEVSQDALLVVEVAEQRGKTVNGRVASDLVPNIALSSTSQPTTRRRWWKTLPACSLDKILVVALLLVAHLRGRAEQVDLVVHSVGHLVGASHHRAHLNWTSFL